LLNSFDVFIEFHTVNNAWSAKVKFFIPFCYKFIQSGNWLQKINILDLSLIKLLQNQQECILMPHIFMHPLNVSCVL